VGKVRAGCEHFGQPSPTGPLGHPQPAGNVAAGHPPTLPRGFVDPPPRPRSRRWRTPTSAHRPRGDPGLTGSTRHLARAGHPTGGRSDPVPHQLLQSGDHQRRVVGQPPGAERIHGVQHLAGGPVHILADGAVRLSCCTPRATSDLRPQHPDRRASLHGHNPSAVTAKCAPTEKPPPSLGVAPEQRPTLGMSRSPVY
jgi:hypothetical protein